MADVTVSVSHLMTMADTMSSSSRFCNFDYVKTVRSTSASVKELVHCVFVFDDENNADI